MNKQKAGRIVGAGAKLKGNKYEKRRPKNTAVKRANDTRTSANDDDVLELPDWQFLFLMFANKRTQLRRTAAVIKQAPKLVGDTGLNMALNLFVAGLVVEYVDPWYSGKLNTDNAEFEQILFSTISDVIASLVGRLTLEGTDYLMVAEESCRILNRHFTRLIPKNADCTNQLLVDLLNTGVVGGGSDKELLEQYLKNNHAYFDDDNNGNTYLEVMSLEILGAIFPKESDTESPISSPLVRSFVASLLGDLVFQKTLDVLSSPEFLIKQIYTHLLPRISKHTGNRTAKTEPLTPFKNRIKEVYLKLYNVIIASSAPPSSVDLLRLQVFSLANLLTDFSQRQPLLNSLLMFGRGIVEFSTYLRLKVNAILMSYLQGTIESLDITGLSCNVISALGEAIFDFKKEPENPTEKSLTVSEMIDSLADAFTTLMPLGFYYQEETSDDMRDFFRSRLELLTDPQLNKLVVLELLDMLLGVLYPELTEK